MSETGKDHWSMDPGQRGSGSTAGSSEDPFAGSWESSGGSGRQAEAQSAQQAAWGQPAAQSAQQAAWGQPAAQSAQQAAWGQQQAAQAGYQGYGQQQAAWGQSAAQSGQQAAWGQQQAAQAGYQGYGQQQTAAQSAQQAAWGQRQAVGQPAQVGYPTPRASGGGLKLSLDLEGDVAAPWAGLIAFGGALLAVVSVFLPWVSDIGDSESGWRLNGFAIQYNSGFFLLQMSILLPFLLILAAVGLIIGITKSKKRLPLIGLMISVFYLLSSSVSVLHLVSDELIDISDVGIGVWLFLLAWIVTTTGLALATLMKSAKTQ